jgi:hypothetical protein
LGIQQLDIGSFGSYGRNIGLNRWECIQVNHHDNVGKTIEEFENRGWSLQTYSAAQLRGSEINHYLLFKRNK